MQTLYDVIVVGAGHAGCEAAHAAARMGRRTLLLTIDLDKLAHMSCNPSIGGPAKGHLVREIDALGGLIARVTDRTAIQLRVLNESKGPAVQSLRAQCDKRLYAQVMKETLERVPNLDLRQAMVERIVPLRGRPRHEAAALPPEAAFAVVTHTGWIYGARALVLTTGTFLRGRAITGQAAWGAGRAGEAPAVALGEDLAALGFPLVRLKTGTPPRVHAGSIDFGLAEVQHGSPVPISFGHYYPGIEDPPAPAYSGPPRGDLSPRHAHRLARATAMLSGAHHARLSRTDPRQPRPGAALFGRHRGGRAALLPQHRGQDRALRRQGAPRAVSGAGGLAHL